MKSSENFPCYFCQEPCRPYFNHYGCIERCLRDKVVQVLTTTEGLNREVTFVHIYIGEGTTYDYHIRLNFIDKDDIYKNTTSVITAYTGRDIIVLPGYPITPANATQKLRTILTFL